MKLEGQSQYELSDDETMKEILIQIERYKRNQLEFFEAIDEFIITSDKILDNE